MYKTNMHFAMRCPKSESIIVFYPTYLEFVLVTL